MFYSLLYFLTAMHRAVVKCHRNPCFPSRCYQEYSQCVEMHLLKGKGHLVVTYVTQIKEFHLLPLSCGFQWCPVKRGRTMLVTLIVSVYRIVCSLWTAIGSRLIEKHRQLLLHNEHEEDDIYYTNRLLVSGFYSENVKLIWFIMFILFIIYLSRLVSLCMSLAGLRLCRPG